MSFKKIEKKSLADAVFEQLRDEIVSGRMEPGEALPAERGLSEMLGVNRGAVREALKRLQQARLVSIQQGGATRVLDFERTAGTDLLTTLLMRGDGSIDTRVARSVLEMRSAIAADIARLAAGRARPEVLDALRALLASMQTSARDLPALQDLSMEFWKTLAQGSDNVAYRLCVNSLQESYEMFKRVMLHVMEEELTDLEGYTRLVDAVEDGEPAEAEAEARALLKRGQDRVGELLDALGS